VVFYWSTPVSSGFLAFLLHNLDLLYRLKEVADFVGLKCSSIISNRTAEAGKTPKIKM
jgi:hypothetical protein